MIKNVAAEKLAVRARESLSKYCYNECMAYCCRRGHLLLSEKEASLLQLDIKDLILMPVDGRYIFNLGKGCPNLKEHKCIIHKDLGRPKACKEFPLFIFENTVIVTDDCPAVEQNQLYAYLAEFKSMGYVLVYSQR
jgi:Fe-S-cluster containining protein